MSDQDSRNSTTPPSSYQRGWDDGYTEGYACKLVDVSSPFMPAGTAAEVDAVADWLMNRYTRLFETRGEAIGMARGMIRAARSAHP